jgi:fatty acid elongase 3
MSIGSGVLFVLLGNALVEMFVDRGFLETWCDPTHTNTKGERYFYYYINYLFKYAELVDTVLLALRDKPMIFLHVYHHAATLVLCWSQLRGHTCVQWVPIFLNLFIHVVMYGYYTLHALKIDVWWKKYLTMAQIVQFVAALIGILPPFFMHVVHDLGLSWMPYCNGEYEGAIFGILIIFSYLLLFLQFYGKSYDPKKAGRKAHPSSSHANKSSPTPLAEPVSPQSEAVISPRQLDGAHEGMYRRSGVGKLNGGSRVKSPARA